MEKHNKCNPVLLPIQWDILTDDWDYVNLKNIKDKCNCICKSTCCRILELLKDRKYWEASQIYLNTFKNEKPNNENE